MEDDCRLPGRRRAMPELTQRARLSASSGDPAPLRDGVDRDPDGVRGGWEGSLSDWIEYSLDRPERIREARFVFDSDLNRRTLNMPSHRKLAPERRALPAVLARDFRLEILTPGGWKEAARVADNARRLTRVPLDVEAAAIRFHPERTWGADKVRLFAWDIR